MAKPAAVAISLLVLSHLAPPSRGSTQEVPSNASLAEIENLIKSEVATVIGASKFQQEITAAPVSVSIITQDDIQKRGYRTLAEILASVPDIYTTYDRTYQYIGVRGFSPAGDLNTRILLLLDGHRLNDEVYQQAPVSDFPVNVDLIDRVEVMRGPGSSLYGTNAFLAVVNVITRSGRTLKGGEIALGAGSYDARTLRATAGGKTSGGLEWLLSGTSLKAPGKRDLVFPEYAGTHGGVATDLDGEFAHGVLATLAWKDLSFILARETRDKRIPTAPFSSIFNDPRIVNEDRHTLLGLQYGSHGGFADLSARLTFNRYEYRGDWPVIDEGISTLNRDAVLSQSLGSDLLATKSLGAHLVTLGMEYRRVFHQDQQNFDVAPIPDTFLDDRRRSTIQGYYLQDEFHPRRDLILNAGIRADIYRTFGTTWNPRAAAIWKPGGTVLRLTYGEAFRAPNAYEQYYGDEQTIEGNPHLQPEKVRSLELNWDQFIGNNLSTTLTAFRTRITGLLTQVNDPANGFNVFENQDRIESRGLAASVAGKWESGVSGRLSCVYQEARDQGTGRMESNAPLHLAKGSFTLPLPWKQGFATLEANYGSSRLTYLGTRIGGATVVDLTLVQKGLGKCLDLSLSARNLFDHRYAVPAGPGQVNSRMEFLNAIPQDGFVLRFQATWRFRGF